MIERTKEKMVEILKREYRQGMVNMFEGNLSARVGDRIFVTPSQVAKEDTTVDMMIEMDLEGNIVYQPEGYKPSSEARMHLEVYRLRPDVKACVHNHSLYATAFSMNNMPVFTDALAEPHMIFGNVPVVPYGRPGTDHICEAFSKYLGNGHAVLLANHGLLTYGPTLELAYSYAEGVEKIAHTIFISKMLGTPQPIPKEELDYLGVFGEKGRNQVVEQGLKTEDPSL